MTDPVTLAHLSDLHLGPISGFHPRYWNVKRGLGYLNWQRGRKSVHLKAVADLIAVDALAQRPDHFVVTGDLANIGLPAEYDAALTWLRALGDGNSVSAVPGNHDIYTSRLHGASCLETWSEYMTSDAWGRAYDADDGSGFPYVRRLGAVALVGLNSAVPTPPFVASGRLGSRQLSAFARTLARLAETGLARIVLIHHPPLSGEGRFRGLDDASEFERIIETHGAELVLHGHNHADSLKWRSWTGGQVPVLGIASGSAGLTHKAEPLARYNLVRISRDGSDFRIEVRARGLAAPGGAIVDLWQRTLVPSAPAREQTA